ncbi:hypothetical protein BOTNAR_0074g00100 [Botryotinia narcissicola]|uniref:Uncharacterized protein n=1 Tax=Botryotinia narcissicola TaxID=278944 RepID=A0A4Z1JA70_9HELO|nr:hypothetical protein BOTNAR_0074g00100 [Botryotinia narcissicola]
MRPKAQETTWHLDKAQDQVNFEESPLSSYGTAADETEALTANEGEIFQTATSLLRGHLVPAPGTINLNSRGLSLPVLLTQRRPVRTKSSVQALSLAPIVGLAAPDHLRIIIGIAVQVATNTADENDSSSKTTMFLDKIIDSFFAPRGLIAVILSWKSRAVDQEGQPQFETSNGISKFEWLETAPLVFHSLDDLVGFETDGSPAQSVLANVVLKETFSLKYSNFNHPVSSGDLLVLVTGGRDGSSKPSLAGSGTFGKAKNVALSILCGGSMLLQYDIPFLMIANRPTGQQLAEASNILRTIH